MWLSRDAQHESVLEKRVHRQFLPRLRQRGGEYLMAGNQSDARRRAEQAYQNAKKSGADKRAQDQLFAEYEAKQAAENAACGTSYRARR